jgi:RNA polymerase sigma factor (sigma-70 family)
MKNEPLAAGAQRVPAATARTLPDGATDEALLERFVLRQDETAFADLVRRYGSLVLAACRRVLHHAQDAEDAFQATFLILFRKAPTLDRRQPLASWLYTVAYHVALDARDSAASRRSRELQAMSRPPTVPPSEPDDQPARDELRRLLDAELHQLPEKYRAPVVLCYLDGRSNEEAARQLGCPVGTVKVRLARARDMLRKRLTRPGLALSLALLIDVLAKEAQAGTVAPMLVDATVETARQFAAGTAATGAARLAEGVLDKMKAQPSLGNPQHAISRQPAGPRAAQATPRSFLGIRRVYLWAGAGAASVAALVLVCALALLPARPSLADKESVALLENLRVLQRTWWDTEGLPAARDPRGAFDRLQQQQRGWWENEGLAQAGNADGAGPLARLETQQRAWFEQEGLNKGNAKDPRGALGRLDEINRAWMKSEVLAKAKPANADEDEAPSTAIAPANPAELADLKVQLLEKDGTRRFLDAGGTRESEEAVQMGLQWLAAQQHHDGSWDVEPHHPRYHRGATNVSGTALALLPLLARGETHKGSQDINLYTKQVERGIKYLIQQQKPDGRLFGGDGMYTHALATIALCEDFGMTADPILKSPCQKAIDYIIFSQDPNGGGWRYGPKMPGDLSVTSWALMALKSGQMAGLNIPHETLEKATQFLKSQARPDGGYNYAAGSPGHDAPQPAVMTAAGIVCRQYLANQSGLGEDPRSPNMTRGVDIILKNPPVAKMQAYYYWYYGTYAMLQAGGDNWRQWNPQVRDAVVSLQNKGTSNPTLKGSWDPPKEGTALSGGGRVGITALALLTLEVYYRHLPLNRPELGEMAKDLGGKGPPAKR